MVTMGEQRMWHDITNIADSLNRIANCMEAAERRARDTPIPDLLPEPTLGEYIRDARRAKGLSQESLAQQVGVASGYFSNVEKGIRGLGLKALNKTAKALDLDPEKLLAMQTRSDPKVCSHDSCTEPGVVKIQGVRYCPDHIEVGFAQVGAAISAVRRGFDEMEQSARRDRS